VKIRDRAEWEAASCDCYQITKELYASLYNHPVPSAAGDWETAGVVAEQVGQVEGNGDGAVAKPAKKQSAGSAKSRDGRTAAAKKSLKV